MKLRRSPPPLSEGGRIDPGRIVGGSAAEFAERRAPPIHQQRGEPVP